MSSTDSTIDFDYMRMSPVPPYVNIGDGNFEYIADIYERKMLQNAYKAIQISEGWDFMKADPGDGGFMFSKDPMINKIMENMDQCIPYVGHSGASFGCVMRSMQYLAINGIEKHKRCYIK
jgi:hypothetical protein